MALFWVVTHWVVLILTDFFLCYCSLKMGLIGFPETSAWNYHYSLHNITQKSAVLWLFLICTRCNTYSGIIVLFQVQIMLWRKSTYKNKIHYYIDTRKKYRQHNYTGRFIMLSVITNIYNKKTNGTDLMELFTTTRKLKKIFLTTRYVRCVHDGWHNAHQCDIQVLA
jgi:hypothetical protein